MNRVKRSRCVLLLAFGAFLTAPVTARAETDIDLALVLAVDISNSMEHDEQDLQREGFIEAFRSPLVHKAISQGRHGRIAVTYMEWAGANFHHVSIPWTVIEGGENALAFAERLARAPLRDVPGTSISGAIDFGLVLLAEGNFESTRRVIDISGDGSNNQGRPVTQARDEAVAMGITINGLPIMLKAPSILEDTELDEYYRDCVIGGSGAFMVPVRDRQHLVGAIRTKIIREIADVIEPIQLFNKVQVTPRTDCLPNENPWVQEDSKPHFREPEIPL
jgi:Protein of unknown function (DUF1194)